MDEQKMLGIIAMRKFLESRLDEVHVKNLDGPFQVKVAGETYGLLGACAIIVANVVDDNRMPLGAALGYIESLVPMLKDSNCCERIDGDAEDVEQQYTDLMEQFKNMMTRGQKKSKRKGKGDK